MPDFGERWKWVKDLGQGGQAHTFLVESKVDSDGTLYALKRLKNLNRIDRFDREIRACMELQHPNILRILDYATDPKGRPFLVTEYCSGGPLSEREGQLRPTLEVLGLFRDICAGVAHAHEKSIVHRDIKPDNIFLREENIPVLGDFGICFIEDDGTRVTATDEVAGSRWYCAPELRDGRLRAGVPPKAADIYSLGKVLYWMLSGGQMFDREQHRTEEYRLGRNDPAPEYELVNQLLDATIVEDPSKRIESGPQLLARVEALINVVRAGGHAITLKVPHRCLFCAQGEYKVVVDGITRGFERMQPKHPNLTITYQSFAETQARSIFGWNANGSSAPPLWLILVCEACGNVQSFRPDLTPNAATKWK